ncbi:MAG: hypothetical protein HY928_15415 [Elusimicrobia bacterium]|nr:hypothetical protein [Elusimicrobiota bacterium]
MSAATAIPIPLITRAAAFADCEAAPVRAPLGLPGFAPGRVVPLRLAGPRSAGSSSWRSSSSIRGSSFNSPSGPASGSAFGFAWSWAS